MESAHRCSSWALICALGRICVTFCNLEMQKFLFLLERSHNEVISHIIRVIKPSYLERSIKVLNNTQMLSVLRPAVPLFKCHFKQKKNSPQSNRPNSLFLAYRQVAKMKETQQKKAETHSLAGKNGLVFILNPLNLKYLA